MNTAAAPPPAPVVSQAQAASPWLVSKRFDLWMFLVPAVIALALVPLGRFIAPSGDYPVAMWLFTVVFIDVSHVWSTIYRTYLDPQELRRRPLLYSLTPALCFLGAFGLALHGELTFWVGLAYLAVYHFIRQQYGWVALLNRQDPAVSKLERYTDTVAIYAATVFPILWWHAHLPRGFDWFKRGDFFAGVVPGWLVQALWPVYIGSLLLFFGLQLARYHRERAWRTSKIIVVGTTAACWGVGIIAVNTDWAFTVTNVIIHGVPYIGIIWLYGLRRRADYPPGSILQRVFAKAWWGPFLWFLALIAYLEEYAWDRGLWGDHPGIFPGPMWGLRPVVAAALMALLAVPQLTHYVLDGFIWRSRPASNPKLKATLQLADGPTAGPQA